MERDMIYADKHEDDSVWYVIWRWNFWFLMIGMLVTGMFIGSGIMAVLAAKAL